MKIDVNSNKCNDCIHDNLCKYTNDYKDIINYVENDVKAMTDICILTAKCKYFRSSANNITYREKN